MNVNDKHVRTDTPNRFKPQANKCQGLFRRKNMVPASRGLVTVLNPLTMTGVTAAGAQWGGNKFVVHSSTNPTLFVGQQNTNPPDCAPGFNIGLTVEKIVAAE
jgi:hypothetical protein